MFKRILFSIPVFILCIIQGYAQSNFDSTIIISPENIIRITYENNFRIKAAYNKLASAKCDFKLFESEYTQFNPVNFNSNIYTNSDGSYSNETSTGMNKEFFNGASVSTSVGNNRAWGNRDDKWNTNYVEAEFSFPLFSSARKLNRIIKRTFEENELYTKNVEYVDAVRNNIHGALEQYYDLVPRIKIYHMLLKYRKELQEIINNNSIRISATDRQLIEGEISSLDSKLKGWEIGLYSMQLNLQKYMNIAKIDLNQLSVIKIDFSSQPYFGAYYINEPIDSIFIKALNNDTEFKVLGIIKKNAEEKKRLAQKGKWDIFATTGSRYNFYDIRNGVDKNGFITANAGLNIKLYDQKVLKYTVLKAQADIDAMEFTIEDRKKQISLDIERLKDGLSKKKDQLISSIESLNSWSNIYKSKKELFIAGNESVDNFIQVFRSLVNTEETRYNLENNYLDTIRDFDYVCGAYFSIIELQN